MDTQLREAFTDPGSRVEKTILFVDQCGATQMKEQQAEASWLPALGWFYDTVTNIALEVDPGVGMKFLGDGILLAFDGDNATEAVNVAIRIQEAVNDASLGRTGKRGTIDFACCAGIGTGSVVAFATPTDGRDYVGTVVDKARRLCDAASPKGILVDRATASAANIMRIRSRLGDALARSPEQYQGDLQRAPLKGFDQPVEYYEMFWDQQLYGLKSETVTRNTDRIRPSAVNRAPSPAPTGTAALPGGREERRTGEITCWKPDAGFGFIRDADSGEDFYFRRTHMVYPEDAAELLRVGVRTAFVASGDGGGARKRQAVGVLVVGEYAEGGLKLPEGKPYGWLRVADSLGNSHHVWVPRSAVERYPVGTLLSFRVGANEKGGLAEDVMEPDEAEAAA